jgi:UDP-glucose 4-epimerase
MSETILSDLSRSHKLNVVSLRYFNVIGATQFGAYDKSEFNLFPNLCRAILNNSKLKVFGKDLPTRDGTCIRDYVDVHDIARAHVMIAEKMLEKTQLKTQYNLGSGYGTSVLEVISAFEEIAKKKITVEYHTHREGDPFEITSNFEMATLDFDWEPTESLNASIKSQLAEFSRVEH